MKVYIYLSGCDDLTSLINYEVTEEQYNFLLKLKDDINRNSSYGCQPTFHIEKE